VAYAQGRNAEEASGLGAKLGQQGRGLGALLAFGSRLLREIQTRQGSSEELFILQDFVNAVAVALVAAEGSEMRQQRDELQAALERALRSREETLRQLIQELSTPIMPIHDGILVLPLIGQIDDERAQRISQCLLAAVTEQRARIVIVDITGAARIDAKVAAGVLRMSKAVRLLGSRIVLVGIGPENARTLVQLDVELADLVTLTDLRGIEYALRQRGMLIQRIAGASRQAFEMARALQAADTEKDPRSVTSTHHVLTLVAFMTTCLTELRTSRSTARPLTHC